jgi:hypothetical protein
MKTVYTRTLVALSALALALGSLPAAAQGRHGGRGGYGHGYYGGHGWGPVPFWGGLGIGLGLGMYYGAPWAPGYIVVQPPPAAEPSPTPPEPVARPAPDPVIYPRSGQSAAQTEADRQDCNRWATTQAPAVADASVFQRAVQACMDARGYTVR